MRVITIALIAVIATLATQDASAQLCRQACVAWCADNDPGQGCLDTCKARGACTMTKADGTPKLFKTECNRWCDKNNPGKACYADCAWRPDK
jgi:hypothetical protein